MLAAQEQPFYGFAPLQQWFAFTPFGFVAMLVFMVCMVAETNRQPFDLPEAESELVAGYNTEYSTKRWVMFMMGEYVNMFIFGAVIMTVFLGGYNALPVNWNWLAANYGGPVWKFLASAQYWLAPIVFFLKGFAVISAYIWLRATLPRLRYDQLMRIGWKVLLPVATFNFMVVALWIVVTQVIADRTGNETQGIASGWIVAALSFVSAVIVVRALRPAEGDVSQGLEPRSILLVEPTRPDSPEAA